MGVSDQLPAMRKNCQYSLCGPEGRSAEEGNLWPYQELNPSLLRHSARSAGTHYTVAARTEGTWNVWSMRNANFTYETLLIRK